MSFPLDDLTDILTAAPAGPAQPMSFRQGLIVEWNPVTAENKVLVGGTVVENLPILNTSEALMLVPGNVVGVMVVGSTWAILGRLAIPGTADAATALAMVSGRLVADTVVTNESVTSSSYGDMATVGPVVTFTVGPTGKLLLIIGASSSAGNNLGADMSASGEGPSGATVPTSSVVPFSVVNGTTGGDVSVSASRATYLTGLAAGQWTFTAKYKSTFSGAVNIGQRTMFAMPF